MGSDIYHAERAIADAEFRPLQGEVLALVDSLPRCCEGIFPQTTRCGRPATGSYWDELSMAYCDEHGDPGGEGFRELPYAVPLRVLMVRVERWRRREAAMRGETVERPGPTARAIVTGTAVAMRAIVSIWRQADGVDRTAVESALGSEVVAALDLLAHGLPGSTS